MALDDFEQALVDYFTRPRSASDLADYRAKRGTAKKLRDEVVPVLHHVKFTKARGEIRFELNSDVPDCWLRGTSSAVPQGLEITVAQSREQQRLGQLMNQTKGAVPGYLGLADDAPEALYQERLPSSPGRLLQAGSRHLRVHDRHRLSSSSISKELLRIMESGREVSISLHDRVDYGKCVVHQRHISITIGRV
jgi:hypothetical protein